MTINKNVEFALKYNKDIPQLAIGDIVPMSILSSGCLRIQPLEYYFYLGNCLYINYRFAIIDRKPIDEQQLVRITDIF